MEVLVERRRDPRSTTSSGCGSSVRVPDGRWEVIAARSRGAIDAGRCTAGDRRLGGGRRGPPSADRRGSAALRGGRAVETAAPASGRGSAGRTREVPFGRPRLAEKVANLRIFPDAEGKSEPLLLDTGGSALVISQFTLYADCRRGRRPSFSEAADPVPAEALGGGVPPGAGATRRAHRRGTVRCPHDRVAGQRWSVHYPPRQRV